MADFLDRHNSSIRSYLQSLQDDCGLQQLQIERLNKPLTIEFYERWLQNQYHGEMTYLQNHLAFKQNPRLINADLRSVISVAQSYFPVVEPHALKVPARVALYAHNHDYHFWLKDKLKQIIEKLNLNYPGEVFIPYVDSGPVLERDLAFQNGLGWFGKNTCLIHPQHGSLFFIAEILTSLKLEESASPIQPLPDFCGKCTKCIDICPTGALKEPHVLKADECISYLTIEAKSVPPIELRSKIGDWFFGCDLCQTVCPWNQKVFRKNEIPTTDKTSTALTLTLKQEQREDLIGYFRFLLTASNKKIQQYHSTSPLSRARAKGLKRNALIVIANQELTELRTEVQSQIGTELDELAQWTLMALPRSDSF